MSTEASLFLSFLFWLLLGSVFPCLDTCCEHLLQLDPRRDLAQGRWAHRSGLHILEVEPRLLDLCLACRLVEWVFGRLRKRVPTLKVVEHVGVHHQCQTVCPLGAACAAQTSGDNGLLLSRTTSTTETSNELERVSSLLVSLRYLHMSHITSLSFATNP